jgi:quercetin dioxygenase-like cupin family protein
MTLQTIDRLDQSLDETVLGVSQQIMREPAGGAKGIAALTPKHVPAGTGSAYWGPGELMTFLITGKESGGALFMAEVSVAPGGGTPPHIHHREDESFHVLEGKLTIQVGGDTITASAGDFAFLPRGIAHSFKNTGDGYAKALVLTTPAGLEGFFEEVFEPATDRTAAPPSPSKKLIGRALAAGPRYGLELLPPS